MTYEEKLRDWDRLIAMVAGNAEDPALEQHMEEARDLADRQDTAQLRKPCNTNTKAMRQIHARGSELALRIRNELRAEFGADSERLRDFGIEPIRTRKGKDEPRPP